MAHFFGVAPRTIWCALIDRGCARREAGWDPLSLDDVDDIPDLDEALRRLALLDPETAR